MPANLTTTIDDQAAAHPTPPRDLSEHDRAGVAGRLHTPTPEAIAAFQRFKADRAAQQQPTPQAAAVNRQYSGDRILANLQRAAAAVNARRMFVLSDDDMADIDQRRADGESWAGLARAYGMTQTTLMAAYARQTAAKRQDGQQCR